MSRTQELRRHLIDEHDVDEKTMAHVGLDWLHEEHAVKHDRRGSIYHTSHKGIDVESPRVETQFHCADSLHDGDKGIHAAWFVRAAHRQAVTGDVIPFDNGRAAAVCDEHLADGVRYVTAVDGITRALVRRENVDTTSVAESAL